MEKLKINYNEVFKEEIEQIDKSGEKPTLFLHACCGPCLTYPLSILNKHFKVTIGYFNPNIYPQEEYNKRFEELKRFVSSYAPETKIVETGYEYSKYLEAIKGHENDLEGGERCTICHQLRLEEAYKYAYEHNFDYFTSVMTVSSKKPSNLLNEICLELETKYGKTKYLKSDFKKEDGQLKGINLAKTYSLYRQNYCGCEFSLAYRNKKSQ